jgi:TRAP-type C4-dicarboxylate transport system substrate-binding protein
MSMRTLALAISLTAVAAGFGGAAHAEERIKLGTLAPNGSPWHQLLKEMGQKWQEASNGQVKLVIYPGGTLGNEGDMVKKTRIGQLQAVALTTIGLHEITPEPQAVDVPMMIDNFEQLDYVMDRIGPKLNKLLESKGYVNLGWSEVGFVRFFSTKRYESMADFTQKAKIFGWEGDPASIEAWRAGGFQPKVMSSTDIVPSLQTGLLDTVALAPLYAFTSRIFEQAKYMLDLPWAVLTGATVVRKDVWERIPADLRPKLQQIAFDYAKKISQEIRRMDQDALKKMKEQGLVVVPPKDPQAFGKAALSTWTVIRGKVVPPEIFDEVKKLVDEARAQKK